MAKILLSAVALATLCVALASNSHHAQKTIYSKSGEGQGVHRSNLQGYNAYDVIEAEDYDFHVNTETFPADDPDDNSTLPREVAYITRTSILAYYEVDFGQGANRVDLRLGQLYTTGRPLRAGVVNIHLNSTDDEPFVSAIIDYGRTYHYITISQYLNPLPSGVQNVYFSFDVDSIGYNLVNFNWFRFYSAYD